MPVNNGTLNIRFATPHDAEDIAEILNFYIQNTPYSMTGTTINKRSARYWVQRHSGDYPMFVAEIDDEIVGWSSLSQYRNSEGYKYTAESSVYVKNGYTGKRIGLVLMKAAIASAKKIGYKTLIACVTSCNEPSIALHKKLGYVKMGCMKDIGYKFDTFYDVDIMQLFLQ